MPIPRSSYQVVKVDHDAQIIYIVDNDQGRSITNDAENVVREMLDEHPETYRIIYRDTDGYWDELTHDGAVFKDFKAWRKLSQWGMP